MRFLGGVAAVAVVLGLGIAVAGESFTKEGIESGSDLRHMVMGIIVVDGMLLFLVGFALGGGLN